MKQYFLKFTYDAVGYGDLELHNDSLIALSYYARTGSINRQGKLVNAINPDTWYIKQPPVSTKEKGMVRKTGEGWKVRLWIKRESEYVFTHYLIHPDGGLPGSKGCLVTVTSSALELRDRIKRILKKQTAIPVYIKQGTDDAKD